MKKIAIRIASVLFCIGVLIDTTPESITWLWRAKAWVHPVLERLGLSQGDWPLFAPNPVLNNGVIVAELSDRNGNPATWTSTDWEKASVWTKFYRFRHMNYHQRLTNTHLAAVDFAEYLRLAVPDRESAVGSIRWSKDNQMLEPAAIEPPVREVKLYKYRNSIVLEEGQALPRLEQTIWSTQINFLARSDAQP
jgi:hypothetical protein